MQELAGCPCVLFPTMSSVYLVHDLALIMHHFGIAERPRMRLELPETQHEDRPVSNGTRPADFV